MINAKQQNFMEAQHIQEQLDKLAAIFFNSVPTYLF